MKKWKMMIMKNFDIEKCFKIEENVEPLFVAA
jgi:hypothetical protein